MTDDERRAPDSLRGKLSDLFGDDDRASDGSDKLESDAGTHEPDGAEESPSALPKRPTDPPF